MQQPQTQHEMLIDVTARDVVRDRPLPIPGSRFLSSRLQVRFGLWFCIGVVIVLVSLGSLQPTEYGVKYNMIFKTMDQSKVYHGGRHWIWPWNKFIVFPATALTIEFSEDEKAQQSPLTTRTKDGLGLSLSISFQYQLERDTIGKLYGLANYYYEPLFIRNARDVLLKAAADYDAPEYWEKRSEIGQEMYSLLKKRLKESYATCFGLQILVVYLPASYEKSIVETQVQKQQIETREKEQQSARIEAETKVIEADYNRNVTVTIAGGKADYFRKTRLAEAQALQKRIETESQVLSYTMNKIGLNSEDLVKYQQFLSFSMLKSNATFLYGFEKNGVQPLININSDAPST